MRQDKLTAKFQAALADAQSLALGRDHQILEPAHVMLALLDSSGGTVPMPQSMTTKLKPHRAATKTMRRVSRRFMPLTLRPRTMKHQRTFVP